MFKPIVIASLLVTAAAQAADQGFYAGAAMHRPSVELDVGPVDVNWDLTTISAIGGYQFQPNFAVEGRITTGIKNDSIGVTTDFAELGIGNSYSVFAKANYDLAATVEIYGLIGYDNTKYESEIAFDALIENQNESESGLAYGGGLSYALTPQFKLALEYLVRPDIEDEEMKASNRGFGLTATFKF